MSTTPFIFNDLTDDGEQPAVFDLAVNRKAAVHRQAEVYVVLGRVLLPKDMLSKAPAGTVVELDRTTDDEADVYVNGRPAAKGKLATKNGKPGIVITTRILNNEDEPCA